MITQQTIDLVFNTVRVEDVISDYIQLKKAGSNYKGLSPFITEKTPSFVVSPSKQIWKDFSSGKGGNAVTFLMEFEGFNYPEAIKHLCKKYNIDYQEDTSDISEEEIQKQKLKETLYRLHDVALEFFVDNLDSEEYKKLNYFENRNLSKEVIETFQLGYSPIKKDAFTAYAKLKGYSEEVLQKSGLSIFGDDFQVDRFRERVIFPIHSFSGSVIGFGGRALNQEKQKAKYLNSPETVIYNKSEVLYGLYQAKHEISKENKCYLVEGYTDVISLHQAGIKNVVASSGTSLTKGHIKLIKRLTDSVTILFDGDTAGIKASFRSIDLLLSEGVNVKVLLFKDGDDPDSFARKHNAEFIKSYIEENEVDFVEFKAHILLEQAGQDISKKAKAIDTIIYTLNLIKNPVKKEIYIKNVSEKFDITLFAVKSNSKSVQDIKKPEISQENILEDLEIKLIAFLVKYGNILVSEDLCVSNLIFSHIFEDNIRITKNNKEIFKRIYEDFNNDKFTSVSDLVTIESSNIEKVLSIINIEEEINIEQNVEWHVKLLILKHKKNYIPILKEKFINSNELDKLKILTKHIEKINKEIYKISVL